MNPSISWTMRLSRCEARPQAERRLGTHDPGARVTPESGPADFYAGPFGNLDLHFPGLLITSQASEGKRGRGKEAGRMNGQTGCIGELFLVVFCSCTSYLSKVLNLVHK